MMGLFIHHLLREGRRRKGIRRKGIRKKGIRKKGIRREGIRREGIRREGCIRRREKTRDGRLCRGFSSAHRRGEAGQEVVPEHGCSEKGR